MTKETLQRYLISSAVTFFAGFAVAVLPLLDNLTLESIKNGALFGLVFVGVRAGLKALLEAFLSWYKARG